MIEIKRALISVADKEKIVDFARGLKELGVEIISTGGTYGLLKKEGIFVRHVANYTGVSEMLGGRVKTLHPKIHTGILAIRDRDSHIEELQRLEIDPIDLVVVNLYPFEKVCSNPKVSKDEIIEYIDIGGVALLRSAAKNYHYVAVVCAINDYTSLLEKIRQNNKRLSIQDTFSLAIKAFKKCAEYDYAIYRYLERQEEKRDAPDRAQIIKEAECYLSIPDKIDIHLDKERELVYGENPHQIAALFYGNLPVRYRIEKVLGKDLSYNNYLDIEVALDIVEGFSLPCIAIIKHNNPSGVACSDNLAQAYLFAWQADLKSSFGGVIGANTEVDVDVAKVILSSGFKEILIAPSYTEEAIELLAQKRRLSCFKFQISSQGDYKRFELRHISLGTLVQSRDRPQRIGGEIVGLPARWKIVSQNRDIEQDRYRECLFAWRIVRYIKSNAICITNGLKTVGIGAGQMSRVDSVRIALNKAGNQAQRGIVASDGFFPFADSIDLLANAGIEVIIQPGGSIRDKEVAERVDRYNLVMLHTLERCFRH